MIMLINQTFGHERLCLCPIQKIDKTNFFSLLTVP